MSAQKNEIVLKGITSGGEATTGLSILADVAAQLAGVTAFAEGPLKPLLVDFSRRLAAALRLLRAENEPDWMLCGHVHRREPFVVLDNPRSAHRPRAPEPGRNETWRTGPLKGASLDVSGILTAMGIVVGPQPDEPDPSADVLEEGSPVRVVLQRMPELDAIITETKR